MMHHLLSKSPLAIALLTPLIGAQSSSSPLSSATSLTNVGATPTIGPDGYTTTTFPPTCTAISTNIYAVNDTAGTPYLYMCGGGTGGNAYSTAAVSGSWRDCFAVCDNSVGCTGFSYHQGAVDGNGAGECILKSLNPESFTSTATLLSTKIAGLMRANYAVTGVMSSSTTSSITSSASTTSSTSSTPSTSLSRSPITSSSVTTSVSSITSSTSSITSTTSIVKPLSCPASNGTIYSTPTGDYQILCGVDYHGGDLLEASTSSFAACKDVCSTTSGCIDVSYVSGSCYLKNKVDKLVLNANVWTAVVVSATSSVGSTSSPVSIVASVASTFSSTSTSVSATVIKAAVSTVALDPCPSYNFTLYTDTNNVKYQVLCGFNTNPGSFATITASNMSMCLAACDGRSGCTSISYEGQTCYLKNSYASKSASSNVNSAFLYNGPGYPVPSPGSGSASSGCGSALPGGIQAGGATSTFYIESAGQNRSYNIHIPSSYNITAPAPLIIAYHGNADTPAAIEAYSGYSSEAWNPFGIVVYPAGVSNRWQNDPATVSASPFIDDQSFTHDLLASLQSTYCIDTSRILGTGMSNGGGFVGVLACNSTLSTQFSAFAISSGAEYTNTTDVACTGNTPYTVPTNNLVESVCSPGRSGIPILEIHGDADQVISYTGGPRRGWCLPAITHWVTNWAVRDGLSSTNLTTSLYGGNVTLYEFGSAEGKKGLVSHYKIKGWTHTWASVAGGAVMDATPVMLKFLYDWTG